jgi:enoyl-CoA hydratase
LYTGEIIDSATAARWGLVERMVPEATLDAALEEWVAAILAAAPRAVRLQKALMREWEELGLAAAIERGTDAFAEAYATDEPKERMARFLSRRMAEP